MSSVVLHSYWRSSSAWRVRIALALKNIPYEYRAVHLVKDGGEQLKPEFGSLNPMQAIPVLQIDGLTLSESVAIIEYLEETRPDVPLLPKDAGQRAKIRRIAEIINADIQPLQNLRILKRIPEENRADWPKSFIEHGFRAIEAFLKESAGKYCFGDSVTLADVFLVPQVASARRFNVDLAAFPTIARIDEELSKLTAFQAAHSNNQPDTPDPLPK